MFARVILLVAVAVVGGMLVRSLQQGGTDRNKTYRPRKKWGTPNPTDSTTFIIARTELAGIRDSFSAEPIDPDRALKRCPKCQAVYHADSIKTLERENRGQCIGCQGQVFDDVQVLN